MWMGVGSMANAVSKTVMVTGAGGFLGNNLVTELARRGHSVCAVTSKSEGELDASGLADVVPSRDFKAIAELLDGTDMLVNCAFPRNVDGRQLADGMDYLQRLFAAAGASQAGAVVNISSQSVYSQTRTEPAREDTPVCLESKYAVAKYASEQLLEAYCGDRPHTNIRLASLIGPGFDQRVVNKMVARALDCRRVAVSGENIVFDYMDVADAACALGCMVGTEKSGWDQVYNLGSGQPESLLCLAELVVSSLRGHALDCELAESELLPSARSSALDASAFERRFNWAPRLPIALTVDRIVEAALKEERTAVNAG